MNIIEIMNGKGVQAIQRLHNEAKKKYGEQLYSSCVKQFDNTKIIGTVETKDGKNHRMTVKW